MVLVLLTVHSQVGGKVAIAIISITDAVNVGLSDWIKYACIIRSSNGSFYRLRQKNLNEKGSRIHFLNSSLLDKSQTQR